MRLTSVTLHPFGRFKNQSFDLSQPLVVIQGPNEHGKSTLRHAIFHALFTPTNLTEAKLRDSLQPWLPLPDGDYAQVTLTFVHGETTWTLVKRWGSRDSVELSNGRTSLGDSARAQSKLNEMLVHNEATYRHILFTGQAELEQTLSTIKAQSKELRDIRDLLKAATGAAADVDEQKLRRLLEEQIKKCFGRWNDQRCEPERQDGKERGIAHPWDRGAGSIVQSWYRWQTHEAERLRVVSIEMDLDRCAAEAAAIEKEIQLANDFVRQFGDLREALIERDLLEERVPRLEQQVATLGAAFIEWPKAEAAIIAWNQRRVELEEQYRALMVERSNAEAKKASAAVIKAFEQILTAKQAWADAAADIANHPDPGADRLVELERVQAAITDAENKLASRQLSWRLDTDVPGEVTVEMGSLPAKTVSVGPEGVSGNAEARIRLAAAGIRLTVESGAGDVDALFHSLRENRENLERLLTACGAPSLAAARVMAERHRDAVVTANNRKQVYESLLLGRTFEQWEEDVAAIRKLPDTRDLAVIDEDLRTNRTRFSDGSAAARRWAELIVEWIERHKDYESLTEVLLEARAMLKQSKDRLAALPLLPEQFRSVKEFLELLATARQMQIEGQRKLSVKREELARLTAELGDRRSEDIAEESEATRRAFERTRARGQDYLKVREVLDGVAAGGGDDPLTNFSEKVAATFSRITGEATTLAFDGQLPASVERGGVRVPHVRLSQGANGALALSLRLTMAEAYLDGGSGFIMLDDPLVNFDRDRLAAAAEILRAFSGRTQVIFCTCHNEHAAQVKGPAPAERAEPQR